MKMLGIASAVIVSIVVACPSLAYNDRNAQGQYTRSFRGYHDMRAQDALHFGRTDIYPRFHSGWGGLYGDGNYPGSIDDNMGPPYWGRW
jgi:hypothetical protein